MVESAEGEICTFPDEVSADKAASLLAVVAMDLGPRTEKEKAKCKGTKTRPVAEVSTATDTASRLRG